MPSFLIFSCKVERFIPRRAAQVVNGDGLLGGGFVP
jgi:hypothetical protein